MTNAKLYRVGLLLALCASWAHAQSLGQFISASDEKNVDSRLGAVATLKARSEAGQAWGALLPALTANGGWTHNQYPAIVTLPTGATTTQTVTIVPKDQLDATLKAEVPLLDASRWFRTSSSLATADAAEVREDATRDQVHRQVVTAFYLLAGSRSLQASALKSLAVSQAQLEQQRARQAAGTATDLEIFRAKAEVDRNRQLVADAEAQVANAVRSLHTLTGLEPREVPSIGPDDLHEEKGLTELEGRFEGLPSIRAADKDVLAASRNVIAADATLAPTVNAQFSQRFTNATGFQGQSTLWNAGLTFNWRLDVVGLQALRGAAAAEQSAALNAERARQQARDQIHSDWQRVHAALTKVTAAKAQVDSAQRASGLARERNAAGVATQLDVIQSDRDVFSAEVNDIQARFDLASARASLHLSAGLPLEQSP
jgi:outer membrane protein TolC